MNNPVPRLALTAGEPAGIGPDLVVTLGQSRVAEKLGAEIVVLGDPDLILQRAHRLGQTFEARLYEPGTSPDAAEAGALLVEPVPLRAPCVAGKPDPANSAAVIATLERAASGCSEREFAAMVTAPVQKSVIADAGYDFRGHTEYLAELCGAATPVMLLCKDKLRVALLTTHLPLAEVPRAVTAERIDAVTRVLHADLVRLFGIQRPRIAVLGLNPHAGESGKLGREEIEVIEPALLALRADGIRAEGPLPGDSTFAPANLAGFDAVLAMFHDQGLPVIKHAGFGSAVNVTLGLPIIRTSVDHGTALELAGTGRADAGSLREALALAVLLSRGRAD